VLRWDGPRTDPSVQLQLPEQQTGPDRAFWVRTYLYNDSQQNLNGVPMYVILEVMGALYFWPSWTLYDPTSPASLDFRFVDIPAGIASIEIIPSFAWPDTGQQSLDGLYFHAVMLNTDQTRILGNVSSVRWGFGP
jgi:hypothetical protein